VQEQTKKQNAAAESLSMHAADNKSAMVDTTESPVTIDIDAIIEADVKKVQVLRFNYVHQVRANDGVLVLHPDGRLGAQVLTKCLRHLPCERNFTFTSSRRLYDEFFLYPSVDTKDALTGSFLGRLWSEQGGAATAPMPSASLCSMLMTSLGDDDSGDQRAQILEQPLFHLDRNTLAALLNSPHAARPSPTTAKTTTSDTVFDATPDSFGPPAQSKPIKVPRRLLQLVNEYMRIPTTQLVIHHLGVPTTKRVPSSGVAETKRLRETAATDGSHGSNRLRSRSLTRSSGRAPPHWWSSSAFRACMTLPTMSPASNFFRAVSLSTLVHKLPTPAMVSQLSHVFIFERDEHALRLIWNMLNPILSEIMPLHVASATGRGKGKLGSVLLPTPEDLLRLMRGLNIRWGLVVCLQTEPVPCMFKTTDILSTTAES
jgi:hypothetical protein